MKKILSSLMFLIVFPAGLHTNCSKDNHGISRENFENRFHETDDVEISDFSDGDSREAKSSENIYGEPDGSLYPEITEHFPEGKDERMFMEGDGGEAGFGNEESDDVVHTDMEYLSETELIESLTQDDTEPGGSYRPGHLAICWTDVACNRALAVGHGGFWNVTTAPYDSNAAIKAAYEAGMDGVKVDVRVTLDNIPVIAHSSPIELYESVDCSGKKIEEMTADEVTKCHRVPSITEKFQRLDEVLDYIRGKMVAELTVKETRDIERTIEQIHKQNAEDFAFIEVSMSELRDVVCNLPGADTVYYLVNVGSDLEQVEILLDEISCPSAFMFEFDPDVDVSGLVTTKLHPAGIKVFTYDDIKMATSSHFVQLFENGFDVVSANLCDKLIEARKTVNMSRGVTPP